MNINGFLSMRPPGSAETWEILDLLQVCRKRNLHERMIEIGSFRGESTYMFALHFKEVYAVDPFEKYSQTDDASDFLEQAKEEFNVRRSLMPNIIHFPGSSAIAGDWMAKPETMVLPRWLADLIYIDANHDYEAVKQDIELWEKHVRPGGILAGHDYSDRFPGVVKAVHERFMNSFFLLGTTWYVIKS